MEAQAPPNGRRWLTRNVVLIGLISLLTDAASEMIIPLLPLFLTTVLHAGATALGLIEGLADAVASVLKLLGGRWSDRLGRTRPFIIAGYSISSFTRPLVSLAMAPWHVLTIRICDRVGKGLRTSPRDALLGRSVPREHHASAYGFHRAMDHGGAVLGPLIAVAILTFVTDDLRVLFALAAIPGALAVIAALSVREAAIEGTGATAREPLSGPGRADLVRFLVARGLFTLGQASDTFLLLLVGATRTSMLALPLLWVGLHVVKSVTSGVGGLLADRIGYKPTLVLGFVLHALSFAAFAVVDSTPMIVALFLVYGLHFGLIEGPEKALVANLVPDRQRGTAFGWFHLTVGFVGLPGAIGFGVLWDQFGHPIAFTTAAVVSAISSIVFLVLVRSPRPAPPA